MESLGHKTTSSVNKYKSILSRVNWIHFVLRFARVPRDRLLDRHPHLWFHISKLVTFLWVNSFLSIYLPTLSSNHIRNVSIGLFPSNHSLRAWLKFLLFHSFHVSVKLSYCPIHVVPFLISFLFFNFLVSNRIPQSFL